MMIVRDHTYDDLIERPKLTKYSDGDSGFINSETFLNRSMYKRDLDYIYN